METAKHEDYNYKLENVSEGAQRAKAVQNLHSLIVELYSVRSREELEKVPQVLYSIYGCAFFAAYFRRCTDFQGWSFSYSCCKWLTDGTDLGKSANKRLYKFLQAAAFNRSGAREYLDSVVRTQKGTGEILNLRAAAFDAQAADQSLIPSKSPQSYTSMSDTASGSDPLPDNGFNLLSSSFHPFERPESAGVALGAASTADAQAPLTAVYPYIDSDLDGRQTDPTIASLHHTRDFREVSALHRMEMPSYDTTGERHQTPFQAPTRTASAPSSDQAERIGVPILDALAAHNGHGLYSVNKSSINEELAYDGPRPALEALHASNRARFKPHGTNSRITPTQRRARSARRTAMRLDRCLRNVRG